MHSSLLPRRVTLVEQAADIIAQGIATGRWQHALPGERQLCEQLLVSRGTLRTALVELSRRKLIRIAHGKSCAILRRQPAATPARLSRVGLLTPEPLWRLRPFVMLWVDQLRVHLMKRDQELVVQHAPRCFRERPGRALATLVAAQPHVCWVTVLSTRALQQWLTDNQIPAVIAGSRHEGMKLPAVDYDHRATARHAASMLLGKGHRHLALVTPEPLHAGIVACEQGFREGVAVARAPGATLSVCSHGDSPAEVCRTLDRMLAQQPRPTAALFARAEALLTAWGHLARRGIRVPEDLSLIVQEPEAFLDRLVPAPTRYRPNSQQLAAAMAEAVDKASRGMTEVTHLIPDFLPGETLARR